MKHADRRVLVPFLLSLLSASPIGARQLDGGYDEAGHGPFPGMNAALSYQTDLYTGRFGYSLPFELVPARLGFKPGVALTYSSNGSNGVCGHGWSLAAGGSIQRDVRRGVPVAWAGTLPLQQYDDARGFVVSFGGLAGPLVAHEGYFRARNDSEWTRFERIDNSWLAVDRSGVRHYFGEDPSSRARHPDWPDDEDSTFQWALSRSVDTNENEILYHYTSHGNQLYLSAIDYNGNANQPGLGPTARVEFVYQPRSRLDPAGQGQLERRISYQTGYRVETSQRLAQVRTLASTQLVRTYDLAYETSSSTLRSRLLSVTESSNGQALAPVNFDYQDDAQAFVPADWGPLRSEADNGEEHWNSVRNRTHSTATIVDLRDFDGDALPDRVMRRVTDPYDRWIVQFNTGTGFENALHSKPIFERLVTPYVETRVQDLNSPQYVQDQLTHNLMIDLNRDGRPDRLWMEWNDGAASADWKLQLNTGSAFLGVQSVVGVTNQGASANWYAPLADTSDQIKIVTLLDINADGWTDRVSREASPGAGGLYDRFVVQLGSSTPGQFQPEIHWTGVGTPGFPTHANFNSPEGISAGTDLSIAMRDINGDGLVDRVLREPDPATYGNAQKFDWFAVQFNTGYGFAPAEPWGPITAQGTTSSDLGWYAPTGVTSSAGTFVDLVDVNADGLLDRVMRKDLEPHDRFVVQINNGTGFEPEDATHYAIETSYVTWSSVRAADSGADVLVDLVDMNADGLVDRVRRKESGPFNTHLEVELSAGPYPDLLRTVVNGIGGEVRVAYASAAGCDNRSQAYTGSPWAAGTAGTLPFPMQIVASVTVDDGVGTAGTTSYVFRNGFYDCEEREFRGFRQARAISPGGLHTVHHFYQGGGIDDTTQGEYFDQRAKAGTPFLVQRTNAGGFVFSETFNRVQVQAFPSGWEYPYVDMVLTRTRELASANPRATAVASTFEHALAGNLVARVDYGRVLAPNPATFLFTDASPGDTLATEFAYEDFSAGSASILDRPERVTRRDHLGQKVDETLFGYDLVDGNLESKSVWLDTTDSYLVEEYDYDPVGNLEAFTNREGVEATSLYDATLTFPVQTTMAGHVTEVFYDHRTGNLLHSVDRAGLRTEHQYDENYRLEETRVSTTAFAPTADLWVARYVYNIQMPLLGKPRAYVLRKENDTSAEGIWSVEYVDGLGRAVQRKAEAEAGASGSYRTVQAGYDAEGRQVFESVPFWSNFAYLDPSTTLEGTDTEHDLLGRVVRTTPPAPAAGSPEASDSPTGPSETTYGLSDSPWGVMETDARGISRTKRFDARGRMTELVELRAGEPDLATNHEYDLLGNVVRTVHPHPVGTPGSLETLQDYDSLGRRRTLTDPDAGTRTFSFDAMGRPEETIDALGYRSVYDYDAHGRLLTKRVFSPGPGGVQLRQESYLYDTNLGEPGYSVANGQLFRVIDEEGWVKHSYHFTGRLLATTRYVTAEGKSFTTSYGHDGVGRVNEMHYPLANTLAIALEYDGAGHLSRIEDLDNSTIYYQLDEVDERDRPTHITFGNGTVSRSEFYPVSGRTRRIWVEGASAILQDLVYTYLATGHVAGIEDDAPGHAGAGLATLSGVEYDGLYRVTGFQRPGVPAADFTYDDLGNLLTNSESGATLAYAGPRPHAVTSGLGQTFDYDANGNMTIAGVGGTTALGYDEEGQLASHVSPSGTTTFGYAHDGQRLWRYKAGAGRTTWIGAHFEQQGSGKAAVKNCFVLVNGKRVARVSYSSFAMNPPQPPTTVYYHADHLGSTNVLSNSAGAQASQFEYAAFGAARFEQGNLSASHRFTSQVLDPSTSLYWMNSRYYDPLLGRFLQPDALVPGMESSQSLNRYTYALNNPLQYVDPNGHFPFLAVLLGGLLGGAQSSLQGGDSRAFWKGFAAGAVTGAAGAVPGGAGQFARIAAGGISSAIVGGNPALGMMGAVMTPGFTTLGARTEVGGGSFDLASLGRSLQQAAASHVLGLAAEKLGFDPMFLQVGLFVLSGAGNGLAGSRFRSDGSEFDGHLRNPTDPGIVGINNRGLVGIPFDVIDIVLAYQGLSTASSVHFETWAVDNGLVGTGAWGHSLGSIDVANLGFANVVTNPDLIALPLGVIAPATATVRIGQQDIVTGFVTSGLLNVIFGNDVLPLDTQGTFFKALLRLNSPFEPHDLKSYPLH